VSRKIWQPWYTQAASFFRRLLNENKVKDSNRPGFDQGIYFVGVSPALVKRTSQKRKNWFSDQSSGWNQY
jgi:hypothetical protein